jgi:hypothetical protein
MDKKQNRCVGINFPLHLLDEIDKIAEQRGLSRNEVVRAAVNVALPLMQIGVVVNTRRTLAILEHTQLALSLLMEREFPNEAAELLRLGFSNVDAHHG